MTGFEPQTSKIGINCSTNWATTTAKILHLFGSYKVRVKLVHTFDVLYITLVSIVLHQLPMLRFTFMYKWPILKHFSTDSYNPHRYPHNGHIGHLFLYIKDKDTAYCVWLITSFTNVPFPASFPLFSSFQSSWQKVNKCSVFSPMTAITTALFFILLFYKMGHCWPLFLLFLSFQYAVDSIQMFSVNKFLPMTGFEPRTSGIGSDRSTNWATTTSPLFFITFVIEHCIIGETFFIISSPHFMCFL